MGTPPSSRFGHRQKEECQERGAGQHRKGHTAYLGQARSLSSAHPWSEYPGRLSACLRSLKPSWMRQPAFLCRRRRDRQEERSGERRPQRDSGTCDGCGCRDWWCERSGGGSKHVKYGTATSQTVLRNGHEEMTTEGRHDQSPRQEQDMAGRPEMTIAVATYPKRRIVCFSSLRIGSPSGRPNRTRPPGHVRGVSVVCSMLPK